VLVENIIPVALAENISVSRIADISPLKLAPLALKSESIVVVEDVLTNCLFRLKFLSKTRNMIVETPVLSLLS
jgi:hypothetical protein